MEAAPVASVAAALAAAKEAEVAAATANEAAAVAATAALNSKEAAAVAATAWEAAAAKDAALAASVAAVLAAAKDAAAAAATAKEATAAAKDAALVASAEALNAKEAAAVAASAGEASEAAAAIATAATVAAAMQASKKRKFQLIDDDQDPPGSGNVHDAGSVDFISRLHDDELGIIVSLLPIKEAVRTQVLSRRWRPLWRSTPLNLVADRELMSKGHRTADLIQKILSEHPGPIRPFALSLVARECSHKIGGWLSSQALDELQELELTYDLCYPQTVWMLPWSAYRFGPTLRVAKFSGCHFTNLIVQLNLQFPCLKQLTLDGVTISEDTLQSMLSGCHAMESLELKNNFGFGRLSISSQTLKSIGFCTTWRKKSVVLQELVIEDTPSLERFLLLDPSYWQVTIRVTLAPKLKILGMLHIPELHLGTTVFKGMFAVSLTTKVRTVKVLVLDSAGPNLDSVINFLKCFPCLERLYVIFHSRAADNVRKYDPLDPIECLELHLKKMVFKNYDGTKSPSIDFVKFFLLNAKVLKEMKITLPYHRQEKWFANQCRLLQIRNRASKDAQIELKCGSTDNFTYNRHTHDLSMADPFDIPSRGCSTCSCGPF